MQKIEEEIIIRTVKEWSNFPARIGGAVSIYNLFTDEEKKGSFPENLLDKSFKKLVKDNYFTKTKEEGYVLDRETFLKYKKKLNWYPCHICWQLKIFISKLKKYPKTSLIILGVVVVLSIGIIIDVLDIMSFSSYIRKVCYSIWEDRKCNLWF